MNKNNLSLILILLVVPIKSWAVELSGNVSNFNGDPVCALVLASGRSMFSCSPNGPFSFSDLPLEKDGSINLQVYARGSLPFFKKLTSFEPQDVRMTRAGSAPVDDGLSGGPLNGTYNLLRVSLFYNDGDIIDSVSPEITFEGTMTIEGNSITQTVVASANGQSFGLKLSGTFIDFGSYVRFTNSATGIKNDFIVVEKGNKVITEVNANNLGEGFSETDQWAKVSSTPQVLSSAVSIPYSNGYIGGLASEIIHLNGHKSVSGNSPRRSLETAE